MSHTQENTSGRQRRQSASHEAAQEQGASANDTETSTLALNATGSTTIKVEGMPVELPNRFAAEIGQPLTEEYAKIIFFHTAGQFRNNQTANAKAREKRFAEAKTEAERNANTAWTAERYVNRWLGTGEFAELGPYMPTVGGGVRQDAMEKMRNDAAWRVFLLRAKAHNDLVNAGDPGIFKGKMQGKIWVALPGEAGKAFKEQMTENFLNNPAYADAIQEQLDLLIAEKESKKTKAAVTAEAKAAMAEVTADDFA